MRCWVPPEEVARRQAERKRNGPHASTFIRVFVNRAGESAFLPNFRGSFPVGTIILKEKLASASADPPGFAVGAMIKHAEATFPGTGGWQFLYADRKDSFRWRDGASTCASCHALRRSTDFVFAGYQK